MMAVVGAGGRRLFLFWGWVGLGWVDAGRGGFIASYLRWPQRFSLMARKEGIAKAAPTSLHSPPTAPSLPSKRCTCPR